MKARMQAGMAAAIAAMATAAYAEAGVYELEPVDRDPGAWRVSVGIRAAPGVKTSATVDGSAAVSAAGRVKPASVGGVSAKGGISTATETSERTIDGGTTSSGTTKDAAKDASGYTGAARYDFENGFIAQDETENQNETTYWNFNDASAFDGDRIAIVGEKGYQSTTVSKKTTEKTTKTVTTETKSSDGTARVAFRETFGDNPVDASEKDIPGFDVQIVRLLWEDADFGIELNAGWTIYDDVDCFKAGGRVYTGQASASRGSVETTTMTKTQTDSTETTTTTKESGSIQTIISQPAYTDIEDLKNPDESIGGKSYNGLPVEPGWSTATLYISEDRFQIADGPSQSESSTESTTTEGTPKTTTSTSRSPAASVSRSRTIDVNSRGELSLQEVRLGVTPFWKATDWLQLRANAGLLGSWAEVETKTTVLADGVAVASAGSSDDDWKLQGYLGLSVAVLPTDRLEISAGAEARFPKRRVRFDDGYVSGLTELSKWDAFVAVGIRF